MTDIQPPIIASAPYLQALEELKRGAETKNQEIDIASLQVGKGMQALLVSEETHIDGMRNNFILRLLRSLKRLTEVEKDGISGKELESKQELARQRIEEISAILAVEGGNCALTKIEVSDLLIPALAREKDNLVEDEVFASQTALIFQSSDVLGWHFKSETLVPKSFAASVCARGDQYVFQLEEEQCRFTMRRCSEKAATRITDSKELAKKLEMLWLDTHPKEMKLQMNIPSIYGKAIVDSSVAAFRFRQY